METYLNLIVHMISIGGILTRDSHYIRIPLLQIVEGNQHYGNPAKYFCSRAQHVDFLISRANP
jgi:hypothetical protein